MNRADRAVFIFVCDTCGRKHYSHTNTLAPFVQREHRNRYFCKGTLAEQGSEKADNGAPRYVS